MDFNLARHIISQIRLEPLKDCISDTTINLNRRALLIEIGQRIHCFETRGVVAGCKVLVRTNTGPQFWIDNISLWAIGGIPVCVEEDISSDFAHHVISTTEVKFISGDSWNFKSVSLNLTSIPLTPNGEPKEETHDTLIDKILTGCKKSAFDDFAAVIFTSGTTGQPKAIRLNHGPLLKNALESGIRLRLSDTDRLMIATPYRFISSISHFLVCMLSGSSFVAPEQRLMPKDLISLIREHGITAFGGSPFHLNFIAAAGEAKLPKLRWLMSSGDYLPATTTNSILENFSNIELHIVYGMAELSGRIFLLPKDSVKEKASTVGMALPGYHPIILDENGTQCPNGEVGDLYIAGAHNFIGYLNNKKETEKAIHNGMFRTGDKGFIDNDGYLTLLGRGDSIIKRAGLKVSLKRIQEAIADCQLFEETHVMSILDDTEGRVPICFVSSPTKAISMINLRLILKKSVPANHIPKEVRVVSELPRTGSGKVIVKELEKMDYKIL